MSDLCIFSANPDPLVLSSVARLGIDVQSYSPEPWRGWVTGKLRAGVEFLRTVDAPVAMWIDGYDTLLLKSEAEILTRFAAADSPVVISAERNCWPDAARGDQFPDVGTKPRFLNSGAYIGRTQNLIATMLIVIECAVDENDQRAWTTALLSGLIPGVQLDYERQLFSSEGDIDTFLVDPCVRHWNGHVQGRAQFWQMVQGMTPNS